MKKYDIAAIGELNVDLILNDIESEPEIGKEKFAHQMTLTLGSSTAIFAANASAIGSKVCFVGMVGKDSFATIVKEGLTSRNVSTEYLIETDKAATGATVCMSYVQDRANLTYQGTMAIMRLQDINPEVFKESKHIHLSSVFMQQALMKDLDKILEIALENDCTTSLDTQWDPIEKWDFDYKRILPFVTIFMPNETELKFLTGKKNLEDAVDEVLPYLRCTMVVKCGSKGSLMIRRNNERVMLPAFINNKVVDTIGAGDSFNSGFISAFVKGYSLEECQRFGNLTGAINTTGNGGTEAFKNRAEVERRSEISSDALT